MDLELKKALENGLSFRRVFIEIIVYSISIFLGFYWKDRITEVVAYYFPEGHGLIAKTILGIIMTVALVLIVYGVMKLENRFKKPEEVYPKE